MNADLVHKRLLIESTAVVFLCFLTFKAGQSQEGHDPQQEQGGIMQYSFLIIHIPDDTVRTGDSARVTLEMSLDCTNHVTRFETVFDTTGNDQKVTLAVYGTCATGPYRPLCAARVVDQDFFIHFPRPGDWTIEGGQQPGEDVVDAVIVVR